MDGPLDISTLATVFWSLCSAMMFAGTFILLGVGAPRVSALAAMWLTLSVNVLLLWSWSLIRHGTQFEHWWSWRYFALAGLFAPVMGRLFQFLGMARLGANITTPITLTHPLVTLLISFALFDEAVTFWGVAGGVLVLGGSIAVATQGRVIDTGLAALRQRRLLLYPLAASLAYGISVVFRKIGIELGSDAITAAAVTTTTSWLLVTAYGVLPFRLHSVRCSRAELAYLLGAGILSSLGPVFLFMALQRGSILIVAPLATTTPLFVLLATWSVARDTEVFTRPVVAGTLATVIGISLLTTLGSA